MTQPATSNQATDLMDHLTKQRKHVLGILENLSEEAMRHPVLPTGWTCAGLVQHLALDDERFWFRQVMIGEQAGPDEFGDDGWQVRPRGVGRGRAGPIPARDRAGRQDHHRHLAGSPARLVAGFLPAQFPPGQPAAGPFARDRRNRLSCRSPGRRQ